jgi:hypothetical protein
MQELARRREQDVMTEAEACAKIAEFQASAELSRTITGLGSKPAIVTLTKAALEAGLFWYTPSPSRAYMTSWTQLDCFGFAVSPPFPHSFSCESHVIAALQGTHHIRTDCALLLDRSENYGAGGPRKRKVVVSKVRTTSLPARCLRAQAHCPIPSPPFLG